jgi:hypothetical protein
MVHNDHLPAREMRTLKRRAVKNCSTAVALQTVTAAAMYSCINYFVEELHGKVHAGADKAAEQACDSNSSGRGWLADGAFAKSHYLAKRYTGGAEASVHRRTTEDYGCITADFTYELMAVVPVAMMGSNTFLPLSGVTDPTESGVEIVDFSKLRRGSESLQSLHEPFRADYCGQMKRVFGIDVEKLLVVGIVSVALETEAAVDDDVAKEFARSNAGDEDGSPSEIVSFSLEASFYILGFLSDARWCESVVEVKDLGLSVFASTNEDIGPEYLAALELSGFDAVNLQRLGARAITIVDWVGRSYTFRPDANGAYPWHQTKMEQGMWADYLRLMSDQVCVQNGDVVCHPSQRDYGLNLSETMPGPTATATEIRAFAFNRCRLEMHTLFELSSLGVREIYVEEGALTVAGCLSIHFCLGVDQLSFDCENYKETADCKIVTVADLDASLENSAAVLSWLESRKLISEKAVHLYDIRMVRVVLEDNICLQIEPGVDVGLFHAADRSINVPTTADSQAGADVIPAASALSPDPVAAAPKGTPLAQSPAASPAKSPAASPAQSPAASFSLLEHAVVDRPPIMLDPTYPLLVNSVGECAYTVEECQFFLDMRYGLRGQLLEKLHGLGTDPVTEIWFEENSLFTGVQHHHFSILRCGQSCLVYNIGVQVPRLGGCLTF